MRLILTIEYDGTPFRGWAVQPGLPTVEAALRQALAETFASVESLAVAGRTDTGVHALGQRRLGRRRGRAAARARRRGAQFAPPRRDHGALVRRGASGLPCPALRALAQLSVPALHPLDAVAVRAPPQLVASPAARRGRAGGRRRRPRRGTRLQGLHAVADAAPTSSSAPLSGRSGSGVATTSTSRSRRTAISATWCGAWSARWSRRPRRSRACSTAAHAPRPALRHRRGACTSWPCLTKEQSVTW